MTRPWETLTSREQLDELDRRARYAAALEAIAEDVADGGGPVQDHATLLARDFGITRQQARADIADNLIPFGDNLIPSRLILGEPADETRAAAWIAREGGAR